MSESKITPDLADFISSELAKQGPPELVRYIREKLISYKKDPELITASLKNLYDLHHTALLYQVYFHDQLQKYEKKDRLMRLCLALGATSGGISTWGIWKYPRGQILWSLLVGLAALISLIAPIYDLQNKTKKTRELASIWAIIFDELDRVVRNVQEKHELTDEMAMRKEMAWNLKQRIEQKPLATLDSKVLKKSEDKIKRTDKYGKLWLPPMAGGDE